MTDDEKMAQRYRELGAEEPPRALDDAILAAARRSRATWSRRWAVPLSLAAVVVLSVTVTLRVQHEQPEVAAPAVPDRVKPKFEKPAKPAEPRVFVPDPAPPAAPVPSQVPGASSAGTLAGAAAEREARAARADLSRERPHAPAAAAAMAKRAEAPARILAETPELELERIAEQRAQGRQDEADRALAEFRKRYPDFRIPEEMRARVERR